MKMKHLIFAMLTLATASSFTSCNDSTPEPETQDMCGTCDNETVVDSLFEYEAMVKKHYFNYEQTIYTYVLTIRKQDFNLDESSYAPTLDSLFYPCPALSKEYEKVGLRVKISGYRKNCNGGLTAPMVFGLFGSKFDLVSITKK